ncbi:hypothetical protein D7U98_09635 [Stenotrophomonas maltophilia]|uniref:hypothetical protein n=1 Tax=Stenotrophomonas maltophilia TaxID=40324 RepID=UPI0013136C05|nr:hypothetical protein [Stenotrophomonas maltophilia]MBA0395659.1 hypothetical protein [Stenotrophomonas maltophilia]
MSRETILRALCRLYASAYVAGHNDTVEGAYVDVAYCDRDEYHGEVVQELLADSDHSVLASLGEVLAAAHASLTARDLADQVAADEWLARALAACEPEAPHEPV